MRFVVVESPFATGTVVLPSGESLEVHRASNIEYARACLHDCLVRHNEAPYASHLLYTQPGVLNDDIPNERELGIRAGLELTKHADTRVFYLDRGFSGGMRWALTYALEINQRCEVRTLGGPWDLGLEIPTLENLRTRISA